MQLNLVMHGKDEYKCAQNMELIQSERSRKIPKTSAVSVNQELMKLNTLITEIKKNK